MSAAAPTMSDLVDRPLAANQHWADVKPVPQDDGDSPVVPINYSPEFSEAMGYFRAVQQSGEKSMRVLALTRAVIDQNPANYTCWAMRRACLFELDADLSKELAFTVEVAAETPKNYQLFHHIRAIVERMVEQGDAKDVAEKRTTLAAEQLKSTESLLELDAKNYHVWGLRIWVLRKFGCWNGELEFVERLLNADLRNNSAWNQRHLAVEHGAQPAAGGSDKPAAAAAEAKGAAEVGAKAFTAPVIEREMKFAQSFIDKAVNNESPWNYLRGLSDKPAFTEEQGAKLRAYCEQVSAKDEKCLHSRGLHVYLLCRLADAGDKDAKAKAVALCKELAKLDAVRAKYWDLEARRAETGKYLF